MKQGELFRQRLPVMPAVRDFIGLHDSENRIQPMGCSNKRLALSPLLTGILLAGLMGCDSSSSSSGSAASKDNITPEDSTTNKAQLAVVSGRVVQGGEQEEYTAVSDAQVVIFSGDDDQSDIHSQSLSDESGNFQLTFDVANLPDYFLMHTLAEGFQVAVNELSKAELQDGGQVQIEVVMQAIDDSVVELSGVSTVFDEAVLHHLGDDYYGGLYNSDFQISSEGLVFEKTFAMSENQLTADSARISVLLKGTEKENSIKLNDYDLGYLPAASEVAPAGMEAAFFEYNFEIPVGLLLESNTIMIESGKNGNKINPFTDTPDYDDFEFSSLKIILDFD